jgi:hypothetical protein
VLPKQRRSTLAMLGKAGVEPEETRVRADDDALADLIGARRPSGVPVKEEPMPARKPYPHRTDRPHQASGDRPYRGGDRPRRGPRRTH